MRYRVVVVGLGRIGMGYDINLDRGGHVLSHVRAFSTHSRFELVAAVDPSAERRDMFQAAYSRPAYGDVESALAAHSPDVVVVAVPTAAHVTTVASILRRTCPIAILCEKPLAYDVAEGRTIIDDCDRNSVRLFVNYMRRSEPAAIEVRRRIREEQIVGPFKGVAWYSKGFLHSGSHLFNLIAFWLGRMVDARIVDRGRQWDANDSEPDVYVRFQRGTLMFLAAREEDFSYHVIELIGQNGRLRYDRGGHLVEWSSRDLGAHDDGCRELSNCADTIRSGMDRYQWHVVNQLGIALDGGAAEICSGTEALTTLEAMRSILEMREAS